MEQDTRIGLALGILLIGVVGALFFRNESPVDEDLPAVSDPESLDAGLAERPIAPYVPQRRQPGPASSAVLAHNQQNFGTSGSRPHRFEPQHRLPAPEPIPGTHPGRTSPEPKRSGSQKKKDPAPPVVLLVPDQPAETASDGARLGSAPAVNDTRDVQTQTVEYLLKPGDTLSDIAQEYLGSSARYMEIFELNRDRLRTPHDLRSGRKIRVPRRRL